MRLKIHSPCLSLLNAWRKMFQVIIKIEDAITFSYFYNIFSMISKLKRLIAIQTKRYEKKGHFNTAIGLGLLLCIVWTSLTLGQLLWPHQVDDKVTFIFLGSFLCHEVPLALSFLIYLPGYMGWSGYYAKNQINTKSPRPWERKNWTQVLPRTIQNLVLTQLLILPVTIYLSNVRMIRVRFDEFPDWKELVWEVGFCLVLDDFLSFWGHRMSHSRPDWYKIHKVHHEYDSLFTWATEYSHPLQYISANLVPSVAGFVILGSRAHCFTYFCWISWKTLMITEGHAGYEFKWSPLRVMPLIAEPSYHDYHHSHNVGNYAASCYLWDVLCDTNVHYINDFLKN